MPGREGLTGESGFGYELGELVFSGLYQSAPFSYGYNAQGADVVGGAPYGRRGLGGALRCSIDSHDELYTPRELRANRVRVPADMIAISDAPTFSTAPWVNCFGITPVPETGSASNVFLFRVPAPVHSRGTNVLFCDGHVQWYPTADLIIKDVIPLFQRRQLNSLRDEAVARMWNADHEL